MPLALIAVPFFVPAVMTLVIARSDGSSPDLNDYLGNLMLYGTFTCFAMVILGLPLLWLYLRLNQRSFLAFAFGGGLCAIPPALVGSGRPTQLSTLMFYFVIGVIAGLTFRLILFGVRRDAPDREV